MSGSARGHDWATNADHVLDVTMVGEEKASLDRQTLDALLDDVLFGHVGLVRPDGSPVVLPTAIARAGDRLLIHGSTGSPWMRTVASGVPVCVAVTAMDGIVVARSAFESSIHYRSAVLFGACEALEGAEKESALHLLTERLLPGRVAQMRASTSRELAATLVLALPITEWSLKVSDGWPEDPEDDVAGDSSAGVVAARCVPGRRDRPWFSGDGLLAPGIPLPESVRRLR